MTIQIPSPCTQRWADMTPVRPDCRDCAACERQIVDFTTKTDADILAHLRRNEGKVCGRFRPDQLNRRLLAPQSVRRGGLTAAATSVAALLMAQQPVAPDQAGQAPVEQVSPKEKTGWKTDPLSRTKDSVRTISGKILDAVNSDPLIGVTVYIQGTKLGTCTGVDGYFKLPLPLDFVQQNQFELTVSYTGYASQQVCLPAQVQFENLSLLPIRMDSYHLEGMLGALEIVHTPAQRARRFFQRLFDR